MATMAGSTRCRSGGDPIQLATSHVCIEGFFCPNNTDEFPPEYCPPVSDCLVTRLQQFSNTCSNFQGIYEPMVCPARFYCPVGGRERIECPSRHFCPLGTTEPIRCMPLSVCPNGSLREFHLLGFLILMIADVILIALSLFFNIPVKWRSALKQTLVKIRLKEKKRYQFDSISDPAAIATVIDNQSPDHSPETVDFSSSMRQNSSFSTLGIDIGFRDLEFLPKNQETPIFQGITGMVPKGTLLGILGPSGAGKSTLVKVLAGRTHQSCGSVILNGVEVALPRFKHLIGFVPQDDSVLSDFTVRESVLYSARVRLTGARTRASIEKHVLCILSCMGLLHIRNSRVCRLSGGERKRVSIAIQLVATPLALVLDEPTSGLDASSALSLLKILKTISTMGVTIVCVMHQPRADIFEILDNVLLLRSGRQVFLGNAAEAEAFFTSKGYTFSDSYNFADALLDIISSVNPMIDLDMEHVPTAIVVNDRTSGEALERISAEVMSRMAPWYRQLWLNFCRESSQQCRRYTVLMTIHFVAAASGLMIGLAVYTFDGHLFHGVFKDPFQLLSSAVDYTLVTQLALLSTLAISLAAVPAGVEIFGGGREVFFREIDSGHSRSAFFLGKDLSTLPCIALSSLHFTSFYVILATPIVSFGDLLLMNMIYFYCVFGIASMVASMARRENALLISLLTCLVVGICNGYGPLLSTVKSWHLEWFWYLCPGTWFAEAYFTKHVVPFSRLYDIKSAAQFNGYILERFGLDIGIIILIGGFYRIISYTCLCIFPWKRGR